MKPVQLVLIAVAAVCALGAGFMMMNLNNEPAPVVVSAAPEPKPEPVNKVLIADSPIEMGASLGAGNLKWEKWPLDTVRESYITQKDNPKAIQEYSKAIARSAFFAGEPVRNEKIVHSSSGYLSAILPSGKRAMAIAVRATTTAGGFVLPNDNVDVILSYKQEDQLLTETILQNIRVLAVDRLIEEKAGKKSKVGRTITLELTAAQTEIIAAAQSTGQLTLALRSVADADLETADGGKHLLSSGSRKSSGVVRIIRYGNATSVRPKN